MITFEQFYLAENLFFSTAPAGGYNISYASNTNLQLGEKENEQVLACKFVGEFGGIKGEYTRGMQGGKSNVYIGYRSIDDRNMRIAAMAAIKGTANRLRQDAMPAAGYKPINSQQYYKKEHYAMQEKEYREFIQKAVNDFVIKAKHQKYGVFLYPESRSKNAEDLCLALKAAVGSDDAYIIPLAKIVINRSNVDKIFKVSEIATAMQKQMNVDASALINAIKKVLLKKFNNKSLSTASDTRSVPMYEIVELICKELNIKLPASQMGGHLDAYTNPHYDVEAFLYDYSQHIAYKNYANRIQKAKNSIILTKDAKEQDKLRNSASRIAANAKILLVDDNINSGDMYRQVRELILKPPFPDAHLDFFYLMCRETYATK